MKHCLITILVFAFYNSQGQIPSVPNATFSINNLCGITIIERSVNPPSSVDWYWQTTSSGTSTSLGYSSMFETNTSKALYLRARSKQSPYNWSGTSQFVGNIVVRTSPCGTVNISGPTEVFAGDEVSYNAVFKDLQGNALEAPVDGVVTSWSISSNNPFLSMGDYSSVLKWSGSGTFRISYQISTDYDPNFTLADINTFIDITVKDRHPQPFISLTNGGVLVQNGSVTMSVTNFSYDSYSWLNADGTPISGANLPSLTVTQAGTYKVRVLKNGLEMTSSIKSVVNQSETSDYNYVSSTTVLVSGVKTESDLNNLSNLSILKTLKYYDGIGRLKQVVNKQASPELQDIVQPVFYDERGYQSKKFSPYVDGDDGLYKIHALKDPNVIASTEIQEYKSGAQYAFYQSELDIARDVSPYSQEWLDKDPLMRPVKSIGTGNDWHFKDKAVNYGYFTNTHGSNLGNEKIIAWKLDINGFPVRSSGKAGFVESVGGYYSTGQLFITSVKDENSNTAREYKNKRGQLIMKKVQVGGEAIHLNNDQNWARTYYVYDDWGNITVVITPELSDIIEQNDTYNPTALDLAKLAFLYKYDSNNRMIEKKLPGAEPILMIYDNRNRLVLTQDGNQRAQDVEIVNNTTLNLSSSLNIASYYKIENNGAVILKPGFAFKATTLKNLTISSKAAPKEQYTFIKYDELNRPIMTGVWSTYKDANTLRLELSSSIQFFENKGAEFSSLGYSLNNSFPNNTNGNPAVLESNVLTVTYYDNYTIQDAWGDYLFVPEQGYSTASYKNKPIGQVTGGLTRILGSANLLKNVVYYDINYNGIQIINENHLSGKDRVTNRFDFLNKLIGAQRTHVSSSQSNLVINEQFYYDHSGRLRYHYHKIGDQNSVLLLKNKYNELGQLIEKNLYSENSGNTFLQSVDYRYNIRGWLTNINNADLSNDIDFTNNDSNDLFGFEIRYNTGLATGASTAQYNGNISEIIWKDTQSNKKQAYGFTYDAMNRLNNASYRHYIVDWNSSVENNRFNEAITGYDKNGNIKALNRNGEWGPVDILSYAYDGNQLLSVNDNGNNNEGFVNGSTSSTVTEYTYDANGNMKTDLNKGISSITYNYLNLPQSVAMGGTNVLYSYDAKGQKLKKTVGANTTNYISGIHYENNVITFIQTAEGRVRKSGAVWAYEYDLKDHLGNARVGFRKGSNGLAELIQKDDYYPFGLTFNSYSSGAKNLYLYNGKEEQEEWGVYDYGARMYMPDLGRWMAVDPLSELTRRWSPYTYCYNNPLIFIDPDGMYGEYYGWNGKYLGSDKIDDKKVYVAEGVSTDKEGTVTSATNAQDLGVTHDEFATSANVVKHESSGNKDESLWIAHAANNAKDNDAIDYKKQNTTLKDQLTDKNYSTTPESARTSLSSSDNSSKANNARSAVIDVYTGGADPTGGAVLWDGDDFLKKGSTHNKFKEYTNVSISATDLWNHAMVPRRPGASIDGTFWPSLVFKSNFSQAGNSKRNYSLNSTGAKGRSVFWKIQKK